MQLYRFVRLLSLYSVLIILPVIIPASNPYPDVQPLDILNENEIDPESTELLASAVDRAEIVADVAPITGSGPGFDEDKKAALKPGNIIVLSLGIIGFLAIVHRKLNKFR